MNRKFWRDAGERALFTFLQAALAAVTMAMAGGAAVLSLGKAMLATRVGDRSSASFLSQV
jgi:hypothetical protein